jgi:phage baseplate assembly protein W
MPDDFYRLPLRLDLLVRGADLHQQPRLTREVNCSLEESIRNHVYLIITTKFREARFDSLFGCTIWDDDFQMGNDSGNNGYWTDRVKSSVRDAVRRYEKRLERIHVEVDLDRDGGPDAHKRLLVTVTAEIRKSNHQPFEFQHELIIAPFISKRP